MELITPDTIESKIFQVRGLQVMLDSDLALLYKVETKVLNQAVRRNIERFPDSFRFQLTFDEIEELTSQFIDLNKKGKSSRSQIVTLNKSRGYNIKYLHLGKKWFAFSKMEESMTTLIVEQIKKEVRI